MPGCLGGVEGARVVVEDGVYYEVGNRLLVVVLISAKGKSGGRDVDTFPKYFLNGLFFQISLFRGWSIATPIGGWF